MRLAGGVQTCYTISNYDSIFNLRADYISIPKQELKEPPFMKGGGPRSGGGILAAK